MIERAGRRIESGARKCEKTATKTATTTAAHAHDRFISFIEDTKLIDQRRSKLLVVGTAVTMAMVFGKGKDKEMG